MQGEIEVVSGLGGALSGCLGEGIVVGGVQGVAGNNVVGGVLEDAYVVSDSCSWGQ